MTAPFGALAASQEETFVFGKSSTAYSPWLTSRLGLQRIAAVDNKRSLVFEDHRVAGRAGKAGEPGEPVRISRHILVLKLIGLGNDKAVQAGRL